MIKSQFLAFLKEQRMYFLYTNSRMLESNKQAARTQENNYKYFVQRLPTCS